MDQAGVDRTAGPWLEGAAVTVEDKPHHHGRVCSTCARKLAELLITSIQLDGALPDGTPIDSEQLLQVFLSAAVIVAAKIPGTESDQGRLLFRELGMAFLELGPRYHVGEKSSDVS